MIDLTVVARSPLLAGLTARELDAVAAAGTTRAFRPGQPLCQAGAPSDRCWILTAGLVDAMAQGAEATGDVYVVKHRKGAAVGDVAVILGEPYPETVVASIPTTALELDAASLLEMVRRFPRILVNALRTAQGQLASARARSLERELGETVAVAVGHSLGGTGARVLAAAPMVSPRPVTVLDRDLSFAGAVTAADQLTASHATVLLPSALEAPTIDVLRREADRVVVLVGAAEEAARLQSLDRTVAGAEVEVITVGDEAQAATMAWPEDGPARVIRACPRGPDQGLADVDLAWLTRHLTRTKLGLALGAGGAKGYAHIGVLQVLEEAGYVVDCVAGSSIGAIVGTHLALGASAGEIDRLLRETFEPDTVRAIFKPSLSGRASGLELMTRVLRESTGERTFADTLIPLTVMAVDLDTRAPAPLRGGLLWEALLAATALAGVFPPHVRQGHRLVDGLALVPVPTGAIVNDGADVTVAVNLISADVLGAWPGRPTPETSARRRRPGMLDNLLEVMDLSQLSESVRHADLADVPITPRFGPAEWRDFELADLFLDAGRRAAQEQLPRLRSLALPGRYKYGLNQKGGAVDRADSIRV